MKIKFWGTRGSIPVPDKKMFRYGGNTTCVEVTIGDRTIIIDSGTGIINLGKKLVKEKKRDLDIFITHSHWDHIHGFPFFLPAYTSKTRINVFGHTDSYEHFKTILTNQMSYEYFPVRFGDLKAEISFLDTRQVNLGNHSHRMSFIRANHPAYTMGIKIEENEKSFVFITDNELYADKQLTSKDKFVEFCYGADYLVLDAQFTDKEYKKTKNWGHSTFEQAFALAKLSKAKNLVFFHHDPNRTDKGLRKIESKFKKLGKKTNYKFNVSAAKEKQEIIL
ncbi:MAG: MBL fold metallo-hydrolase [Elusimicrobia bacterium]|nr:MBL fold metallo-hydrolase [Elusimicrobiota bacterium]